MSYKSVYNFVSAPSEKEVYQPHWANQTTHDLPFEDGESGEIRIKIEAKTPIFIRNGQTKENPSEVFSNIDNHFFLPATSIKGMLRNVLEIMSYSRLNAKLVNNHRYSFRDLTIKSEYLSLYKTNKVRAGWLTEKDGQWEIEEVDFYHIKHETIKSKIKNFKNTEIAPNQKTAKYKYETYTNKEVKTYNFSYSETVGSKKYVVFSDNQDTKLEGQLIFTGQPGDRKEPIHGKRASGKGSEFVFGKPKEIQPWKIEKNLRKDFLFIYGDETKDVSEDWAFWKEKLGAKKKIPIFFLLDDKNDKVESFGLAYMYKLPFKYNVHEMKPISGYTKTLEPDLATTLFGYTDETTSLKGRVFVSNAFAVGAPKVLPLKKEILGGPKASFYPFYLKSGNYNNQSELSGFKRYRRHDHDFVDFSKETRSSFDESKVNENVFSKFTPLDKGTVFEGVIRFHNLKAIEIGALLSAISFHDLDRNNQQEDDDNRCFHYLGGAKPYAYGMVSIDFSVRGVAQEAKNYMLAYQDEMLAHVKKLDRPNSNWLDEPRLSALFHAALPPSDSELQYGNTISYPELKEHVDYKKAWNKEEKQKNILPNLEGNAEKFKKRLIRIMGSYEGNLDLDSNYDKLQTYLNGLNANFNETHKSQIEEAIVSCMKHNPSKKKLTKPFEETHPWQQNIVKWLGEEQAKLLYNKINNTNG